MKNKKAQAKKLETKKATTKKPKPKKKSIKPKDLDFSFSLVGKYVGKDEYKMIVSKNGNTAALTVGLCQLILEKKDFRNMILLAIKHAERATSLKKPIAKVSKKVEAKKKKK